MWEVFWTIVMILVVLAVGGGILISLLTIHRQAIPAEESWKSLYHIHNPPEDDEDKPEA